jgi:WD40 repeat protein
MFHALEVEGHDTSVRSWDFTTGKLLHVFWGHSRGIICLGISGDIAVSGSADSTIRIWDLVTGKSLHIMKGDHGQVTALVMEGNLIVSSGDRTIRFWDLKEGTCIACIYADERIMKLKLNRKDFTLTAIGDKGGEYTFHVNIPS